MKIMKIMKITGNIKEMLKKIVTLTLKLKTTLQGSLVPLNYSAFCKKYK